MVANAVNNLGLVYREMDRFEDALSQHERAKAIQLARLGTEHPGKCDVTLDVTE